MILFKILKEITPVSLSNISIRWILNLVKCFEGLHSDELEKCDDKLENILKIIQDNSSVSILKYFMAEMFCHSSTKMQMVTRLIKVFDNDRSIDLYVKEINIPYFKSSFSNLKNELKCDEAMSFMSKLAFKITKTCGDYELELMRNENFVYQMFDVFTDFNESYSAYLLLTILRLSIRFKIYDELIAKKILEFLPIFFNKELNTEELKILIEYLYSVDKQNCMKNDTFIDSLLLALINKVKDNDSKSAIKLEATLIAVEKCLNENILMNESVKTELKNGIDKFKVEFML